MIILNDFDTSVVKALTEIDPKWEELPGVIVCGTHSPAGTEGLIDAIEKARTQNLPFLGICFGMQLMAIEYMRNVMGINNATSKEFGADGQNVVIKMPEIRVGLHAAGWDGNVTNESFWHNYRVDIDSFPQLWDGFEIIEIDGVVTYMKLKDRKNYFGVQFHPEYQSSKDKPHPLLLKFINLCKEHGN